MMSNTGRIIATVIMWLVLGTISIVAITNNSGVWNNSMGDDILPLVLGSLFFGLVGTYMIWVRPEMYKYKYARTQNGEGSEKAKRQGSGSQKMALLLELMDEDEREAFKETLKRRVLDEARIGGDGEITYGDTTLESLFYEEDKDRQRK